MLGERLVQYMRITYSIIRSPSHKILEFGRGKDEVFDLVARIGAAVSGTDEDLSNEVGVPELPGEGVFAAATAKNEDTERHGDAGWKVGGGRDLTLLANLR